MAEREATAPDLSNVPTVSGYIETLNKGEQAALDPIVAAMQAREKPLAIYTQLENEAGLPQLRTTAGNISKEIGNLEDTLSGLSSNISGRTRESLVTEAQRQRMLAAESEPLKENLSKLTTGLGRIESSIDRQTQGISTKVGLALQGQEMELEPMKLQYSALVDRNARNLTGFTEDRQTLIDQVYAKWQRGNEISDQEWQAAQQAAMYEQAYNREVKTAAAAAGVTDFSGSTQDLLSRIGSSIATQQLFENSIKTKTANKSSGTSTGGISFTPSKTTSSDWSIVSNETQGLLDLWGSFNTNDYSPSATIR